MTRPAPDWFGPDDPEMQREFLEEINAVHREIARRDLLGAIRRESDQALRAQGIVPIRPSFTTGELTPKMRGRVDFLKSEEFQNFLRRPGIEP